MCDNKHHPSRTGKTVHWPTCSKRTTGRDKLCRCFDKILPVSRKPNVAKEEKAKMASSSLPREHRKTDQEIFSLHDMFRVVGDQLTSRDVRSLKGLYNSNFSAEVESKINDGFTFLLAMERLGRIDDSNFRYLTRLLRIISRLDLIQFVSLKRRKTVSPDPVNEFLEHTAKSRVIIPFKRKHSESSDKEPSSDDIVKESLCDNDSDCEADNLPEPVGSGSTLTASSSSSPNRFHPDQTGSGEPVPSTSQQQSNTDDRTSLISGSSSSKCDNLGREEPEVSAEPPLKRQKPNNSRQSGSLSSNTVATADSSSETSLRTESTIKEEIRRKVTCDIRLRVRAEYCNHEAALQGNIHSNKPELLERQFERFFQANTILKSRDLGSIICDIKFSELTYLDAFWRDYINGSLLEALKGVFITDSLKQAVGHEAIKLLVNVDEDDYFAGRIKLLQNLKD